MDKELEAHIQDNTNKMRANVEMIVKAETKDILRLGRSTYIKLTVIRTHLLCIKNFGNAYFGIVSLRDLETMFNEAIDKLYESLHPAEIVARLTEPGVQDNAILYTEQQVKEFLDVMYTEAEVKELLYLYNKSHGLSINGSHLEKWWETNKKSQ